MKTNLNKIKNILLKHKWFIVIFIIAAVIRFIYLQDNMIPFLFDHGKDSLAILHLIAVPKLKFIGPWTSIPGLYFGPAWYYLLAPFYYVSGYSPVSAAVAMSLLVLFQMYLVYKHFNIESAAIIGFSGFWLMMSKSAWNPFPMTLLSIIILILLFKQLKLKEVSNKLLFGLAVTSSFGFHFSSAFAIFYPIIILSILLLYKYKISIKNIILSGLAFTIPFIPQLLFEFKNDFPQYNAVINYFTTGGEGDGLSLEKIREVISTIIGENKNIIFESNPANDSRILLFVFIVFIIYSAYYIFKNNKLDKQLKDLLNISLIFFLIPMIGFIFLHFNLWYVYPLVPVATILIGSLVSKLPKQFSAVFILIYVLTGLFRLNYFIKIEKPTFVTSSGFYPIKKQVIDYIRNDAGNNDFSVYTYKQDIYDFPYQYEFLVEGLKGKTLPLEFAYEPNVVSYVKEKNDILNTIDEKYGERWKGTPRVIYYIVTVNDESELLGNWWGRQIYGEIIAEKKFGNRLVVYTATPFKD